MTEQPPEPVIHTAVIEANPRRPYKALAAFLVSLIGLAWVSIEKAGGIDQIDTLGDWLGIFVPALCTAAAVYGIKNPLRTREL